MADAFETPRGNVAAECRSEHRKLLMHVSDRNAEIIGRHAGTQFSIRNASIDEAYQLARIVIRGIFGNAVGPEFV